jgi:NitT/TauT family transport system substrate-binding protein
MILTYLLPSRSIPIAFLLLAGILTWTAGCKDDQAGGTSSSGTGSNGAAKPTSNVSEIRVGYFANLTHAQAVLGVASGDFERTVAPAKVKTKVFNAGPSLVEALFAGEIDIGYVGPGPALAAHGKSRGRGVRVIAGAAANGVLIVARDGAGINSLEDLKGKRLATPQQGNTQDIAARHYLTKTLGQSDTRNVLPIANAEQAAMMSQQQVDASWAPEPWGSLLAAQAGARVIGQERDLWPDKRFAITLVVTTPEFLEKHPDVVERVLGVHRQWTDKLKNSPQAQVPQLESALFALTKKQLPPGVLKSAVANVEFTDEPLEQTLRTMAQWSFDVGISKDVTDITGLIDTTILRKLERSTPPAATPSPGAAK